VFTMQKCLFRVDYKVEAIDRQFGTIIVETKESKEAKDMAVVAADTAHVGLLMVRAGWAKV
jgi:hypothetical protein